MKLLLTGATGFVGRNCLLPALAIYDEIYAPVRNAEKLRAQLASEGLDPAHPRLQVLAADPAGWPAIFPDHAILAAGVLFARNSGEYFSTNVEWTLSILRVLPAQCRCVVLSSQSAGGPTPPGVTARREEDANGPITWYGESKLALENAIQGEFPGRSVTSLRPPMILGARDTATLPLFRMAGNLIRPKPGWRTKTYSFIAVDDLADAIFITLARPVPAPPKVYFLAHPSPITDRELIAAAAESRHAKGWTLPIPLLALRLISKLVDAVPALRAKIPSLTRDRVREIWPDRWVIDGTKFSQLFGWQARRGLKETMRAAHDHYVREGFL